MIIHSKMTTVPANNGTDDRTASHRPTQYPPATYPQGVPKGSDRGEQSDPGDLLNRLTYSGGVQGA
jgi:hypothetical protein